MSEELVELKIGNEYEEWQLDFLSKTPFVVGKTTYLGKHPYTSDHMFACEKGGSIYVPDGGRYLARIKEAN